MTHFQAVLLPHAGPLSAGQMSRRADVLLSPAQIVYQGIHRGHRPLEQSFLTVDAPNVVVSAIKQAEDGKGFVVRLVEQGGQQTEGRLVGRLLKTPLKFSLKPFEIATWRFNNGNARRTNLLER